MKSVMKFGIAALSLCFVAGIANAADRRHHAAPAPMHMGMGHQRMAGCGLGSMLIEDNSKWPQVGASLLNGTGFQSFAISFGTSNCTEEGVMHASREKEAFVESNLADLRSDVSAGHGEYLSALAALYGCNGAQADAFSKNIAKARGHVFTDVASVPASLQVANHAAATCHI